MLTPRISFGPIQGVMNASFSLSRGEGPSACTITTPPVPSLDGRQGTLYLSDGFRSISFKQCVVGSFWPTSSEGVLWRVAILDRRWKWQFGQISGEYNIWKAGERVLAREKNARELVKLVFAACGETDFDVSRVPTDAYPHVAWDMTKPSVALAALLQELNLFVTLSVQDRAVVYPDGVGMSLPSLPYKSFGTGLSLSNIPDSLGVTSAPFAWQFDLELEPVGLDRAEDGEDPIKPINELSYTPAGGWGKAVPPPHGKFLPPQIPDKRDRDLAIDTVWKWYRAKVPAGNLFNADIAVEELAQILPLLDYQLGREVVDESTQEKARKKPQVYGRFFDRGGTGSNNASTLESNLLTAAGKKQIYKGSFQIDNERGVVKFADTVFLFDSEEREDPNKNYAPAELRLRVAINFRDKDTHAAWRQFVKEDLKGVRRGTQTLWIPREDVHPEWASKQDGSGDYENTEAVEAALRRYLAAEKQRLIGRLPENATYPYLVPFAPDGRIATVTFAIDGEGLISTTVSKDGDQLGPIATIKERRDRLLMQHAVAEEKRRNEAKKAGDDNP